MASCALGHMEYAKCPDWKGGDGDAPSTDPSGEGILLPWTGSALGLSDLSFVAGRSKPIVVGIVGPESAGKTTLLASWYLLLGRGLLTNDDARFAGSYSLGGWEAVASALRWLPGQPPSFPQHTTSRGSRTPGLLHLSYRDLKGRLHDLLFADAPGEWFQRWAVNANASEAQGAQWISNHADIILLVADRQALSGEDLGLARNAFQLLATRVASERRDQQVALVWTKADVEIDPEMERQIKRAVINVMPDASEFSISVFSKGAESTGRGFRELFDWVRNAKRPGVAVPHASATGNDPLFVFGRR
jgi:Double-GTPase 2